MKKTLLILLSCIGVLCIANAQAPRVYDTATSTNINYPSSKTERPITMVHPETEPPEFSIILTPQPVARKVKASEKRARKKTRTALAETKVQTANLIVQSDAGKTDTPGYPAKGTY